MTWWRKTRIRLRLLGFIAVFALASGAAFGTELGCTELAEAEFQALPSICKGQFLNEFSHPWNAAMSIEQKQRILQECRAPAIAKLDLLRRALFKTQRRAILRIHRHFDPRKATDEQWGEVIRGPQGICSNLSTKP